MHMYSCGSKYRYLKVHRDKNNTGIRTPVLEYRIMPCVSGVKRHEFFGRPWCQVGAWIHEVPANLKIMVHVLNLVGGSILIRDACKLGTALSTFNPRQ